MDVPDQPAPRKWFNWRIILILLILLIIICVSVILTDRFSPRPKTPVRPATTTQSSATLLPGGLLS